MSAMSIGRVATRMPALLPLENTWSLFMFLKAIRLLNVTKRVLEYLNINLMAVYVDIERTAQFSHYECSSRKYISLNRDFTAIGRRTLMHRCICANENSGCLFNTIMKSLLTGKATKTTNDTMAILAGKKSTFQQHNGVCFPISPVLTRKCISLHNQAYKVLKSLQFYALFLCFLKLTQVSI